LIWITPLPAAFTRSMNFSKPREYVVFSAKAETPRKCASCADAPVARASASVAEAISLSIAFLPGAPFRRISWRLAIVTVRLCTVNRFGWSGFSHATPFRFAP
jgi:hypothetical protein